MPSAKYALALSSLRFSNGSTAIDFSGTSVVPFCFVDAVKRPKKNKLIDRSAPTITMLNPDVRSCACLRHKIDILRSLQTFRRQFKYPCDDERDWKSDDDCEHD